MQLTIGKLAERADVNVETVRYYERRGLVPPPARTPSGYRTYERAAVDRIRFIKRAQDLGFSLKEIAELLDLRVTQADRCEAVEQRARGKIVQVDSKIRELTRMKRVLSGLAEACCGNHAVGECPILDMLEQRERETPVHGPEREAGWSAEVFGEERR